MKQILKKLSQTKKLTKTDYRIVFYLIYLMDHENWVPYTQTFIGEQLKIDLSNVGFSIRRLEKLDYITPVKRGKVVYFLVKDIF